MCASRKKTSPTTNHRSVTSPSQEKRSAISPSTTAGERRWGAPQISPIASAGMSSGLVHSTTPGSASRMAPTWITPTTMIGRTGTTVDAGSTALRDWCTSLTSMWDGCLTHCTE